MSDIAPEPDPVAGPPPTDAPRPAVAEPTTTPKPRQDRALWTSLAVLALAAAVALVYVFREDSATSHAVARQAALDQTAAQRAQAGAQASSMAAQANASAVQASQSANQAARRAADAASAAASTARAAAASKPTSSDDENQAAALSPPAGLPAGAPGADQPGH